MQFREHTKDPYEDEDELDDEQDDGESKKRVVNPSAGKRRETLELKDEAAKQSARDCRK